MMAVFLIFCKINGGKTEGLQLKPPDLNNRLLRFIIRKITCDTNAVLLLEMVSDMAIL